MRLFRSADPVVYHLDARGDVAYRRPEPTPKARPKKKARAAPPANPRTAPPWHWYHSTAGWFRLWGTLLFGHWSEFSLRRLLDFYRVPRREATSDDPPPPPPPRLAPA